MSKSDIHRIIWWCAGAALICIGFIGWYQSPENIITRQLVGLSLDQVEAKYGPGLPYKETFKTGDNWDRAYVLEYSARTMSTKYLFIRLDKNSIVIRAKIVNIES
jgi:hypothetical protein